MGTFPGRHGDVSRVSLEVRQGKRPHVSREKRPHVSLIFIGVISIFCYNSIVFIIKIRMDK